MSNYKISDSKWGSALQVEYTGKKLSLANLLDKVGIKQFDVLFSEDWESDVKLRSGVVIDIRKNLFYSIRESGLIKKLQDMENIEYQSCNEPKYVDLHGNLFWLRWEKDKIYASINPLELAKNAKKAYKKLDKRLYKIFDEHLPPYKEVIKQEIEKLKEEK